MLTRPTQWSNMLANMDMTLPENINTSSILAIFHNYHLDIACFKALQCLHNISILTIASIDPNAFAIIHHLDTVDSSPFPSLASTFVCLSGEDEVTTPFTILTNVLHSSKDKLVPNQDMLLSFSTPKSFSAAPTTTALCNDYNIFYSIAVPHGLLMSSSPQIPWILVMPILTSLRQSAALTPLKMQLHHFQTQLRKQQQSQLLQV
eukprot:10240597-Ditylum_brightwellii.AAC.1